MKILEITSKTYGKFEIMLDDEDYDRVVAMGSWCVRIAPKRKDLYYFQHRLDKHTLIELHRFIMNAPKGKYVDHINHNTLDNRKCNLRVCSNSDNVRNGKPRVNNTTGYNGVHYRKDRNRYVATIKVNYKSINLGSFIKLEDAVKARKDAEEKYFCTDRR